MRMKSTWMIVSTLAALGATAEARAAEDCAGLLAKMQDLEANGHLADARTTAEQCYGVCQSSTGANERVWGDTCKKELDTLQATTPSVVFAVKDRDGNPTSQASVSLKGSPTDTAGPITPNIDGRSFYFDPGPHTLVFTLTNTPGVAPIERAIQLKRGDRDVSVEVSFAPNAPPPPDNGGGGIPAWAWAVGGVGLASLATGMVFVGLSVDGQHKINIHCPNSTEFESADPDYTVTSCADGGSIQTTNNLYQALAGVFGGIGGAAIIVGIVGIATAPKSKPAKAATIEFVPVAGTGVVGGLLRGAF
ncbi:MAG: hypothetical protein U0414_10130 [Polyangiaceae bacterium]